MDMLNIEKNNAVSVDCLKLKIKNGAASLEQPLRKKADDRLF